MKYPLLVQWVIPEKINTPPTDDELEILAGRGVEGSGNPGERGALQLKILPQGSFECKHVLKECFKL